MNQSLYGFAPGELNSEDTITAVLAHWNEPQSSKPAWTEYPIGTYGIVYAGQGREGALWGGGPITKNPWPMLAKGVLALLAIDPEADLVIYAHEELWRYVGPDGHARLEKNEKRSDFAPFRELIDALRERKWTQGILRTKRQSEKWARGFAEVDAANAARRYREEHAPSFTSISADAPFEYREPDAFTVTVEGP